MKRSDPHSRALKELRAFGLTYPGAHTKSPWPGHLDVAVRDRTFAYLSVEGDPFKMSCKLPESGEVALALSFTEPTPYGLGKSGWVTVRFPENEAPPVDMLKAWIDESYRAIAPKKLVAAIGAAAPPRPEQKARAAPKKKAPAKKKAATKKPVLAKKNPVLAKKKPGKKTKARTPR